MFDVNLIFLDVKTGIVNAGESMQSIVWGFFGFAVAFGALVFLLKKGISYGLAILLYSIIFSLLIAPRDALELFHASTTSWTTINLALIVTLIGMLGYTLERSGKLEKAVKELGSLVKRTKVVLATIPATFGLLPVAGGALFSAPLIKPSAKKLKMKSHEAAYINVWFRHIIFLIFPLASQIVLAGEMAGVSIYRIVIYQAPLLFVYALVAYYLLLRKIPGKLGKGDGSIKKVIAYLSPIFVAIGLNLVGVPLVLALLSGLLVSFVVVKVSPSRALYLMGKGFKPDFFLAVIGIMFFARVFEVSPLFEAIEKTVPGLGLSPAVLLTIVPFLLAFALGSMLASIGVSITIFFSLCVGNPVNVALVHVSVLLGYLISPIHLCNAVTLGYFRADPRKFFYLLLPSSLIVLLATPLIFALY